MEREDASAQFKPQMRSNIAYVTVLASQIQIRSLYLAHKDIFHFTSQAIWAGTKFRLSKTVRHGGPADQR